MTMAQKPSSAPCEASQKASGQPNTSTLSSRAKNTGANPTTAQASSSQAVRRRVRRQ